MIRVLYLNNLTKVFSLIVGIIIMSLCYMHGIASADSICLIQPIGSEVGVSGEEITVEWIAEDLDAAWEVWFYYYYEGTPSDKIYIASSALVPPSGDFDWNLPNVTEKKRIKIGAQLVDDGPLPVGGPAGRMESGFITVYPDSTSRSLYLVRPHPNPCDINNKDNVPIQSDSDYLIEWETNLCEPSGELRLDISYSTDGGATYTYIPHSIKKPITCTIGSYSWRVPKVDGKYTNCKIRLEWAGETATHVWPFTITPGIVNLPPTADGSLSDDEVIEGRIFNLNGTASSDPEGDPLTYEWEQLVSSEEYRVQINDYATPGHSWATAPNVPFDMDLHFKLTVSDGVNSRSHTIAVTVLSDEDGDGVPDDTDNCPEDSNPNQEDLLDGDGVGDVCDNCPDVSNSSQTDSDDDGIGDSCDDCPLDEDNDEDGDGVCGDIDNCPEHPNDDQRDWDNDDLGDACDCADWVTGANEYAADCGGMCPNTCESRYTSSCLPVFINGPNTDKIDIVFVRADEYTDEGAFIQDAVMPIIWESFDAEPDLGANLGKYNFWVAERDAAFWVTNSDGCGWIARKWRRDCPYTDIAAVIHLRTCNDKTKGDTFSAEWDSYGTVRHELGHALFDFGDEYNKCSTNYHEANPKENSNIWRSAKRCRENTEYDTSNCNIPFTTCEGGYHKGNPGLSIMKSAEDCNDYPDVFPYTCGGWGDDAIRQLDYIHAMYTPSYIQEIYSPSVAAATTQSQSKSLLSENPKAMVADFWFDGTAVKLQDVEILYGETPDRKIPYNGFKLSSKDSIGQVLSEFTIRDPRIEEYQYPAGATSNNTSFEFSQVLQFSKKAERLEISENESGLLLGELDLAPYISTFCSQFPEDEDCQCTDIEVCDGIDNNCDGQIDEYCVMPLPTSQEAFGYSATKIPELDISPSQAKPIGVGSVAVGGDTIDVIIELIEFSGPADVYFGIHAPLVDPNIYILTSAYKLQPLSMGLYPWKENTTGPIDETLFADISTSILPPGTYHLYLGVTPTGTIDTFYLWSTEFVVP